MKDVVVQFEFQDPSWYKNIRQIHEDAVNYKFVPKTADQIFTKNKY